MLSLLIGAALAAAPAIKPATAVDAERAFAADARRDGQWTAARNWADPTAVMFEPQAVWVQQALKNRKNPPRAYRWSPTVSYASCDGRTALNVGSWQEPGGATSGTFSTMWMRQPSGDWRWIVDSLAVGKGTLAPRARTERASCRNTAAARAAVARAVSTTALTRPPGDAGQGNSADGTIAYRWIVSPGGARRITVRQWNGRAFRVVLDQRITAKGRLAKPGA